MSPKGCERVRIIGITGGIGSGKSTVSRILYDLGAKVIDADMIARETTSKGSKAYKEILDFFGEEILDEKGNLNRKKLSGIVFKDKDKLEALNRITHKYIAENIETTVERLKNEGEADVIVIDAPLPLKQGFLDLSDEIWVVAANAGTRVERVMERSNLSYEEASDRINSQWKDEDYLRIADEVIRNDGSMEELEKLVVKLFFKTSENSG
jgi:dephospho-CoA kinase